MRGILVLAVGGLLVFAATASAGPVLLNEGFEEYPVAATVPDTAFLYADSRWGMDSAKPGANNFGILEDGYGIGLDGSVGAGQALRAGGGKTLRHNWGFHLKPTDAAPMIVQFDLYDKGQTAGTSRIGIALSDVRYGVDGLSTLVNAGSNSMAGTDMNLAPGGTHAGFGYTFRLVNAGATYPTNTAYNVNGTHIYAKGVGGRTVNVPEWVRFRMEYGATYVKWYVDRGVDGTWDNTESDGTGVGTTLATDLGTRPAFQGWYQVQLGVWGGSSGNEVYLDNIYVEAPEPATLALLGFGGLLLRRRR